MKVAGSAASPPRRGALPNAHRWIAVLGLPLALVWAVPSAAAQRSISLASITHRDSLDNGMRVIVVENHSLPLATVDVVVKTGAMSQDSTDEGVPHLFEHMLFAEYRGTEDASFASDASELDASYNGETNEERVSYYLTLPSKNVDKGIDILAGLLRNAHFERDELNKERMVVLDELRRDVSDPRTMLDLAVSRLLWGIGWAQKNTMGSAMPLFSATPQRLDEIFHQYYVPNNAALVVTGDVNAPKVLEWARSHFGGWKRRADPYVAHPVPPVAALKSSLDTVITGDVHNVRIMVQWQGPSVHVEQGDSYAADVLSQLVNDDESDFQKQLVESGLFQSASIGYTTQAHVGPIEFDGVTTMDHLAAALTVLQTELMMMNNESYFTPEALAVAAKQRRIAQSFDLELGPGLAFDYADWWATSGLDYWMTYGDSLATRTPTDLQRYAQKYFVGRPFVIGVLVRPEEANAAREMLAEYLQMSENQ
ncbi:MAG TPA: pitrilysin family protein [Gemmatimonadaceae bacterium]|nr:pitrilysin family protein [Gemmatimonadaceae bacterium]